VNDILTLLDDVEEMVLKYDMVFWIGVALVASLFLF
jgi:hypothetical protein